MITDAPRYRNGDQEAVDSGVCVVAKNSGTVTECSSDIKLLEKEMTIKIWLHISYQVCKKQPQTLQSKAHVIYGQLVSTPAIRRRCPHYNGETALERTPLIGFSILEGYNLRGCRTPQWKTVEYDVYTSGPYQEYEVRKRNKARTRKRLQEMYRVGDDALRTLMREYHKNRRRGKSRRLVGKVT